MKKYLRALVLVMFLTASVSSQEMQTINITSLILEEKIAQMVIVRGDNLFDSHFTELGIGGFFLDRQKTKKDYKDLIKKYQEGSKIKPFFVTDLEGYWNPFPFYKGKTFGEIKTTEEANKLGKEHGKILREIGFNFNFSPVVEGKNIVWPGRSFPGSTEEIKQKSAAYIQGLQEQGILATAKHYPGGSMIQDPHWFKVKAEIKENDLSFFQYAIDNGVAAIMIGHPIVRGAIDSRGKQATVSREAIEPIKTTFNGLLITDDINMYGLRSSYFFKRKKMYVDAVKAGNDIVLDSAYRFCNYRKVKNGINAIVEAIKNGEISEQQIDQSISRILEKKGYRVVR